MVISRTVSWPFRRRRENALSSFETSKNGHFVNGNPAVSPVARNRFSGSETSEKNGQFANRKPAVSPEARIPFLKLRNVQKWSLLEWEPGGFAGGEETFFRLRNVGKMVISRKVSRPFRWRRETASSNSESSKNGHFANGNTAVSYFGRKIFRCRNVGKNCHFANGKPVVSPEARIRFPRLLNSQKWSHR